MIDKIKQQIKKIIPYRILLLYRKLCRGGGVVP
jgi:hypothetical protein